MMYDDKIIVLMSTYNGEKYLEAQLDSILNQTYKNIELWIRDDGSSDNTVKILRRYKTVYDNIQIIEGKNIGASRSFLSLLKDAPCVNYYAFSDQDDIWLPPKIEIAVNALKKENDKNPLLYCSSLMVVDNNMVELGVMHKDTILKKGSSLVDYKGTGCTMLFNDRTRNLVLNHLPDNLLYHDMWVYHTCVFLGKVVFDNTPHILYRQHGGNAVGWEITFKDKIRSRWRSLHHLRDQHYRENEAKQLLLAYDSLLSIKDKELIRIVSDYKSGCKNKLKFVFTKDVKCDNFFANVWLILRIFCGIV